MRYMSSDDIRRSFLEFFEKKGHKILPSASLIPDDPQLLFTVAGMVPFKPIFWGKVEPVYTRIATCQKCLRTVDIENVGKTPRHHTFFEMLGNFSFGDYFKEEAITWAWEYVTQVLGVPEEKLWVSVYEEDEEAYRIWREVVGVPSSRIVKMGKEDNFWGPAGPTGPCGPDTEIFYDTGVSEGCSQGEECTPANSEGRFVEIWNLVFTEYYQDEEGKLHPLPRKNIDTGAGLERIAAMMQGVYSNFETDLFKPIIEEIENTTGVQYGQSKENDISIRVIADHIRAITFLISDGVFPSNEGRGYVLRRIIRRALRHGVLLGMKGPFLHKLVSAVVKKMGKVYREIVEKEELVREVLKGEEERFLKMVEQGLNILEKIVERCEGVISGADAFKLYDTYGFPLELTMEIAKEKKVSVDVEGFEELMRKQKERARKALGTREFFKKSEVFDYISKEVKTVFTGYERLEDEGNVFYVLREGEIVNSLKEGEEGEVVIDKTPFYAEKGGQVADTGELKWNGGKAHVVDTFEAVEGLIVHRVVVDEGVLKPKMKVKLVVDEKRRKAIMRNHTATHLLHAALRKVLGEHVKQSGSLVEPSRLRFDFTHYKALSPDELERVEDMVNDVIMRAIPVEVEYKSYDEAVKEGAIALFNEKYGDVVRVVKIDDFSEELCGGTHVSNTGEIGLFKILSESSISAGVRRIEATTGFNVLRFLRREDSLLNELKKILESSEDQLIEKVKSMKEEIKRLEKKVKDILSGKVSTRVGDVVKNKREINGIPVFYEIFEDVPIESLRNLADNVVKAVKDGVVILFSKSQGRVSVIVKVSGSAKEKLKAKDVAQRIAKFLEGGGGGREDFAQAGGKKPENIGKIMENLDDIITGR